MGWAKALLLALVISAWALAASEAVVLYLDGVIDGTAVTLARAALAEAQRLGLPLVVVINTYGRFHAPMDQIVECRRVGRRLYPRGS